MKITIVNPTKAILSDYSKSEIDHIRETLTYSNTSAAYLLKRHYNNKNWQIRDVTSWASHLEELKKSVKQTLLFQHSGSFFIRPGSIPYLDLPNAEIISEIEYPEAKKIPWEKVPKIELYPYQKQSIVKLMEAKHANVELCTGSGKSNIIVYLCRELGLKTAIITPSKSIFNELVDKFDYYFGKNKIGKFGDGKKTFKNITVCIGDSLVNVKPGTKEWDHFSNLECVITDESHLLPAETLEEVCHNLLANIPYRFFLSGTQIRGDGSTKLLQSIIGPTVHTLSTKEAVDGGYICPHEYRIVSVESSNPNQRTNDPLEEKRVHFLGNKNIAKFIADFATAQAKINKRQTLVLVEELGQISMLLKLLKDSDVSVAIAHSESKADRLRELGIEKVKPAESVEKFNKAETMILIGTSCISTGTNIYANHFTMNWVGGASIVKTLQGSVGRSVRLYSHNPWKENCIPKEKCIIFDFNVWDNDLMVKHLKERIDCYKNSGSLIKLIKL